LVTELGEPAASRTIQEGGPPDLPRLLAVAGKHGITLHLPPQSELALRAFIPARNQSRCYTPLTAQSCGETDS
jgi:hypothetical protein